MIMDTLFSYFCKNECKHWKSSVKFDEVCKHLSYLTTILDVDYSDEAFIKYMLKKDGKFPDESIQAGYESIFEHIETNIDDIEEKLEWIRAQPRHEQRTKEWFDFRHSLLTASSLDKILGKDTRSVIYEKILPPKDKNNADPAPALAHGIMYEPVAQKIYETMKYAVVEEFGCIRHGTYVCIGASPDGIVKECSDPSMIGRMLEIKCVYSRHITGLPSYKYWLQVQQQLEVCNLDKCDFFECDIRTLNSESEYLVKDVEHKGIIIDYKFNGELKREYIYDMEERDKIIDNPECEFEFIRYWYLDSFSCRTIQRQTYFKDTIVPKCIDVWRQVELHRNNPALAEKLKKELDDKKVAKAASKKQKDVPKETSKETSKEKNILWLGDY